jgi:hypothetical protein
VARGKDARRPKTELGRPKGEDFPTSVGLGNVRGREMWNADDTDETPACRSDSTGRDLRRFIVN